MISLCLALAVAACSMSVVCVWVLGRHRRALMSLDRLDRRGMAQMAGSLVALIAAVRALQVEMHGEANEDTERILKALQCAGDEASALESGQSPRA